MQVTAKSVGRVQCVRRLRRSCKPATGAARPGRPARPAHARGQKIWRCSGCPRSPVLATTPVRVSSASRIPGSKPPTRSRYAPGASQSARTGGAFDVVAQHTMWSAPTALGRTSVACTVSPCAASSAVSSPAKRQAAPGCASCRAASAQVVAVRRKVTACTVRGVFGNTLTSSMMMRLSSHAGGRDPGGRRRPGHGGVHMSS